MKNTNEVNNVQYEVKDADVHIKEVVAETYKPMSTKKIVYLSLKTIALNKLASKLAQ